MDPNPTPNRFTGRVTAWWGLACWGALACNAPSVHLLIASLGPWPGSEADWPGLQREEWS